jgi:hypothetical protein
MKTAQGAISVDVSKFTSGIDNARAKLVSFGNSLNTIGNSARIAWKAFDLVTGVSERISIIAKGARDLQSIFNALPTVIKRVSDGFSNLKTFASQVGDVLSKIPTSFKVIGASAVVAGVSIFATVKALQAISGATKSALSGISSVASGLSNMAKSATASVGGAVSSAFNGFLSILKPLGVAVGGLGIAFGALDRFFKIGIMSAIEMGDEMKNLAGRTGASIPFLTDLQKLLKNSGVSSMSGAVALQNMQRALTGVNADGEPTNDMLARLKLNVDDLMKMTPEQQFMIIGKAISNLSTSAEQTAASFSIFGRAGASLKGVFKEAGFAELGTKQSQLGVSLAKNADNFSKISAKLRDSGSFFRGFFVEMAGAIAPSILELFKFFEGGDMLSGFGAKLGEQIRLGIEVLTGAFKSGMIFELLKISFEAAIIVFQDLFERTIKYIGAYMNKVLSSDALSGIGGGLIDMFAGSLKALSGLLIASFQEPLIFFKNVFDNIIQEIVVGLAEGLVRAVTPFGGILKKLGVDASEMLNVRGGLEKTGLIQSPENIDIKNRAKIGSLGAGLKDTGLDQIAEGAKKMLNGAKSGLDALTSANVEFEKQGEKARNTTADLVGQLNAVSVAGRASAQAIGEVAGAEVLGAKTGKSASGRGASDAVSSLRRIGGGGSAFTADPMIKESQKQTAVIERVVKLVEPISKKANQFMLMPSMSQQGMAGSFLS